MGSKRLKAIAVSGSQRVPIASSVSFLEAATQWSDSLSTTATPHPARGLKNAGVLRLVSGLGGQEHRILGPGYQHYLLASRNMSDPESGRTLVESFTDSLPNWQIEPQPAFNCPIGCSYNCHITTGPMAGYTAHVDGGFENVEGGIMLGIEDAGVAMMMTDYFDAIGIDSADPGSLLGMAFELYNRGLITKEDTDGLELTWGNHEAAVALLDKMMKGEGIGALLAHGLKEAARALHPDAHKFLVHVKGAGINLHDWRARGMWAMLFSQFVGSAGATHGGWGVESWTLEPDLGYVEWSDPFLPEKGKIAEKVEETRRTRTKKLWEDCHGVCWFATWGVKDILTLGPRAVSLATGWEEMGPQEALTIGERVDNLLRLFCVQRGFSKEDEFDIGPRLLEAPASGPAAGKTIAPYLADMVDEYYRQMGWEVATGRPTPQTLARLGLAEYA
ncbi:MAG: aldehyde ferredoxin oxidoreductase C-terminal domain-containing protein [Dehalococcoidia bacterium]